MLKVALPGVECLAVHELSAAAVEAAVGGVGGEDGGVAVSESA